MSEESGTLGVKPIKISVYSGTVAADKDFTSRDIKVYVTEFLPYASGTLEATEVKTKLSVENDRGEGGGGEATLTNTVTATYGDMFTNRFWPPDIRKGEQVWLYNIGDSDKFYWISQGRDDKLRRCEKFRIAISDSVEYTKELSNENTWFFELNTLLDENGNKVKRAILSTCKGDNEKYAYTFLIDAVNNTVVLQDDINNLIKLQSEEHIIFARNNEGSCWELNKKNASVVAVEDLTLKAGNMIVFDSPMMKDSQDTDEKTSVKESDYIHMKANKGMVITTPMLGIQGPEGSDGKPTSVDITVCGKMLIKAIYALCNGIISFKPGCQISCEDTDSSSSDSGGSISALSFVSKAMTLLSASVSEVDENAPIEENRPEELRTEFADGNGATELRDDAHFHNSNVSSTTATPYVGAEIDINTGVATLPENQTQNEVDNETGRHLCAWDQSTGAGDRVSDAIQSLREAIDKLADKLLGGSSTNDDGSTTSDEDTKSLEEIKKLTEYADKLGVEARVLWYNSFVKSSHTS